MDKNGHSYLKSALYAIVIILLASTMVVLNQSKNSPAGDNRTKASYNPAAQCVSLCDKLPKDKQGECKLRCANVIGRRGEETFTDNFDGTNLDTTKWKDIGYCGFDGCAGNGGGSVSVSNSKAIVYQPYLPNHQPNHSIKYLKPISGNFTAEVSMNPNAGENGQLDSHILFVPSKSDGSEDWSTSFSIGTYGWMENGNNKTFGFGSTIQPLPWKTSNIKEIPLTSSKIRLRIVRKGSTIKGYINTGKDIVSLGSLANVYGGNVFAFLTVHNDGQPGLLSKGDVSVTFSRFHLKLDK